MDEGAILSGWAAEWNIFELWVVTVSLEDFLTKCQNLKLKVI